MYLLYCDETNMEEKAGDFLLYAGVSIPPNAAADLVADIEAARRTHNVPKDFQMKFNPGPPGLSNDEFIALKRSVLTAADKHGVKLFAYVVLHDLARSQGADEARLRGINTVLYHFDCYLNRKSAPGTVLLDRFNNRGNKIDKHVREKVSVGLTGLPYSSEMRLKNVLGVHYSAIGQSQFCSLVDIVVGSLRFAINAHTRSKPESGATARELLRMLDPLFFREEGEFASGKVSELGLQFSPKAIRVQKYREKYQGLKDFLAENGIEVSQAITNERTY